MLLHLANVRELSLYLSCLHNHSVGISPTKVDTVAKTAAKEFKVSGKLSQTTKSIQHQIAAYVQGTFPKEVRGVIWQNESHLQTSKQ